MMRRFASWLSNLPQVDPSLYGFEDVVDIDSIGKRQVDSAPSSPADDSSNRFIIRLPSFRGQTSDSKV